MMEAILKSMGARTRTVDDKPTSLVDLGYNHAGLDDGFQACGSGPVPESGRRGFHNASGYPDVDASKFPDMVRPDAAPSRARTRPAMADQSSCACGCLLYASAL